MRRDQRYDMITKERNPVIESRRPGGVMYDKELTSLPRNEKSNSKSKVVKVENRTEQNQPRFVPRRYK